MNQLGLNQRIDRALNWIESSSGNWEGIMAGVVNKRFSIQHYRDWYDLESAIESIAPGKSFLREGDRRDRYDKYEE